MKVIELFPSVYCLQIKDMDGNTHLFIRKDPLSDSGRVRLDLFENENAALNWIAREQEVKAEYRSTHARLERLIPCKISLNDFAQFMKKYDEIDSVTFLDKNGVCRLYFRADFENDFLLFPPPIRNVSPTEPIYILCRQRKLEDGSIIQKEYYFVTYPEIATPLLSLDLESWADDLLDRKPDQGYYIEETTLEEVYQRKILDRPDTGMFILAREKGPHYLLGTSHLKKIVEGSLVCQ